MRAPAHETRATLLFSCVGGCASPKRKAATMVRRSRKRRSQRQKTRQSQTSHTEELVDQEVAQELVDQAAKAATQSLQL